MVQDEPSALNPKLLRLTDGGPAGALFRRLNLVHSGRRRETAIVALVLALITWLPLMLLGYYGKVLVSGAKFPLLDDFGADVRLLFSLPLLILAEVWIDARAQWITQHLVSAGLVAKNDELQFVGLIQNSVRLRDSRVATLALVFLTAVFAWLAVSAQLRLEVGSWMQPTAGAGLSLAGYWYVFIALPIYQFILLRWGYRIIVWGYFLSGLASINLQLIATHPDRAGGIGFLGRSIVPFGVIGLALSASFSATMASRILFAEQDIYQQLSSYGLLVAFSLIISIGPLLFFTPRLLRLKLQGIAQYGTFATTYTQAFQRKWITAHAAEDPELLGTGDIQSLADLGNGFQTIQDMKLVPVTRMNLLAVALPTLLPALPLTATVMPAGDLLRGLTQIFL